MKANRMKEPHKEATNRDQTAAAVEIVWMTNRVKTLGSVEASIQTTTRTLLPSQAMTSDNGLTDFAMSKR